MAQIDVQGDWGAHLALLRPLVDAGHAIVLARAAAPRASAADLVLVALAPDLAPREIEPAAGVRGPSWLAWNSADAPDQTLAAYQGGALAVLPAATTPDVLHSAVENALAGGRDAPGAHPARSPLAPPRRRVFARGAYVALDRSDVLEIEAGVLAQTVVHADGAEVLLGLVGCGGMLIGHGSDGCGLRLQAQSELTVTLRSWTVASREPDFPVRVTARLRQMEAWAAMQARPYLDQRLLGLLGLLAEAFGVAHTGGAVVDVRITHAQLASAIGATRTTVTRLLGDLRTRGLLDVTGYGAGERFVLPLVDTGFPAHADGHYPSDPGDSKRVRRSG